MSKEVKHLNSKIEKDKHKQLRIKLMQDEITYQDLNNQLLKLYLNDVIQVKDGKPVVELDNGNILELKEGQLQLDC